MTSTFVFVQLPHMLADVVVGTLADHEDVVVVDADTDADVALVQPGRTRPPFPAAEFLTEEPHRRVLTLVARDGLRLYELHARLRTTGDVSSDALVHAVCGKE